MIGTIGGMTICAVYMMICAGCTMIYIGVVNITP